MTVNLSSRITYPTNRGTDLPIMVLMHDWSESVNDIQDATCQRIANYGFVVVAAAIRTRGSSPNRDAFGRECFDIYDALNWTRNTEPYCRWASKTRASIAGYSAGGGTALACACKFPDLWMSAISHFGMSDFGRTADGWWYNAGNPSHKTETATMLGGTPAEVPNAYYARDTNLAITQFTGGKIYLIHDEDDTVVPIIHSQRIKTALDNASMTNYQTYFSDSGDPERYTHGWPWDIAAILGLEADWCNDALSRTAWTIPASGTVTVLGYIVTKRFTIWLRANGTTVYGKDAAATVVYDTATDTYTVTPLTGAIDITITQGAKTGSATNINSETEIVVT